MAFLYRLRIFNSRSHYTAHLLTFVFVDFESTDLLEVKIVSSGPCVTEAGMSTEVLYSMKYEVEGKMEVISALSVQTITVEELNAQLSTLSNPQVRSSVSTWECTGGHFL